MSKDHDTEQRRGQPLGRCNDFLYGTANADTIATNMEAHIRQLAGAGARTLVVPNLPPLEDTPEIQSRSASQQTTIRNEVIDYNNQLANIIISLQAELGITIHTVDAWTIFGDITTNKEALGLTNVQDAACSGEPRFCHFHLQQRQQHRCKR